MKNSFKGLGKVRFEKGNQHLGLDVLVLSLRCVCVEGGERRKSGKGRGRVRINHVSHAGLEFTVQLGMTVNF